MKKKLMSEEALKALYAEEDVNLTPEAINETEEEVLLDEDGNPIEAKDAADAADAENTGDDISDDTEDNTDVDAEDVNELAEMLQTELDETKALHAQALEDLAAEAVELATKNTADLDKLKEIVAGQITRMRTALKFADADMSDWAVDALVVEYDSTKDAFMKALPVGSVIPSKDTNKQESPVVTSLDASKLKSLGIK